MGEAKRRKQTGAPAPRNQGNKKPALIAIAVVVVVAVIAAVYFMTTPPAPTSSNLPVAAKNADQFPAIFDQYGTSVGAEDAPVVVREFADYQCPACARFSEASQRLKKEYVDSGKVRFVYFDLPLRQHANAMPAAQAARCAGDQGEYWAMHDKLYGSQSSWSGSNDPVATFTRYANDLGLEERRFRRCMTTELHKEAVEQSLQVAMQLRVASTPTVLVDNIQLTRPGWGQLSAVVERELNKAED
ncbi:Disulfide bond formation protein D precursor [Marinobacter litoralis]|uniref:Disulfide bond formation protein D n=1 Tax=Marinobacter litoralis TaxID=187981 RepID=A0A3M2RG03_9GAMM|nr:thioredoxin domain-containing protein [Marinobacter litoralis]RMJ04251.1 Disulfide bond formation protein D precursor [Marinobacter litoralis]